MIFFLLNFYNNKTVLRSGDFLFSDHNVFTKSIGKRSVFCFFINKINEVSWN